MAGPVLAKAIGAPESFVAKLLQQLAQAGLVNSRRGVRGGFELACPASGISLLDVVEAIEGPTEINLCIPDGPNCPRKEWCAAHQVFAEGQAALTKVWREATIEKLARDSVANLERLHGSCNEMAEACAPPVDSLGN